MAEQTIKTTDETIHDIIKQEIKRLGNDADLNHIDVSDVTDMRDLFRESDFNGNISGWDVSNVKDMRGMFAYSKFTGDLLQWNVSSDVRMWSWKREMRFERDQFDPSQWNDRSRAGFSDEMFEGTNRGNPLEYATPAQLSFVKATMKKMGISEEQFLADADSKHGVELEDINEMRQGLARVFLEEHVPKMSSKKTWTDGGKNNEEPEASNLQNNVALSKLKGIVGGDALNENPQNLTKESRNIFNPKN